jgi:RNA polymerase sigma-70 factor (ECF subfamily)
MRRDVRELSDTALAVAVGRLEPDALRELYRRYGAAVFGIAKRVLRDRSLAEDVVQDVFTRFWNEPERFDPDLGTLRAFLVTKAHARAVEIVRGEEARRARQERSARHDAAGVTYDLEREVWQDFVRTEVRDALRALDSDRRRAIELAYYEGLTYRDVAQRLELPEGTVKSRIRLGLRDLRRRLEEQGVLSGRQP